ncbi:MULTISPECIES: DUF262 domain-containing protein [Bacillus]|uniref:GmrSD restriction endonucleases N-terminal domain-containing protein n=1 Tax=Bacillus toyonensis TaxID=155322 RepID=A0AAP8JWG5_9BACI|nr:MULTISPECIES: DUF262 domain-containing protein [Bacillus]MBK5359504.1 DUF262 domain-containing protein [Bacillus sp. TH44]MBK5346999.1 DUF262 domain-containing protein [Bacillus sp. TH45]MBK5366100.1 DUF262 domain-containing protein [Bacillus sp. TH50]PEB89242.1 hypothetical protein CON81_30785 [Bacillus toyonensis]PHE09234.1 hypothetical protein COF62_21585 [Bacillus toyonensis]
MSLENEIAASINEIKTDAYRMSIGEIANLYNEGDIEIFPEYQRYFRWNINQKSDLIESIILGIPIPPIFVAQEASGKWDVIDGLQRISTILEFMGILKKRNQQEELYEPSQMTKTKFLPSLEGKWWDNKDDTTNSLSADLRRKIKRSKLDFIIIDSTANPKAKYEMFQRLNTNNSKLTDQEIRNCLMLMVNPKYFETVNTLAENAIFKSITCLTAKSLEEQFDKELIVRYIIARSANLEEINLQQDIGIYLTEELINMMELNIANLEQYSEEFIKAIELLNETLGDKAFKKYNRDKENSEGGFSLSLYESLVTGLSESKDPWENKEQLIELIKQIPYDSKFEHATLRGRRPIARFQELTMLSRELFKNED